MNKSLLNSLLGVNSLESIISLKELSEGKGRKPLVLVLKEELNLKFKEEQALDNLVSDLMSKPKENVGESLNPESSEEISEGQKGVIFILNHIKKMKRAQKILKSVEIMALYKKTFSTSKSSRSENKSTTGILVNKRQY